MFKSRLLTFVIKELRAVLPPTVFFAISFNLLVLTTQLILSDYLVHFASFMLATMCALVVGKSVLLANALPFFSRFDTAPMIQPILFKTFVYWAVVLKATRKSQIGFPGASDGALSVAFAQGGPPGRNRFANNVLVLFLDAALNSCECLSRVGTEIHPVR